MFTHVTLSSIFDISVSCSPDWDDCVFHIFEIFTIYPSVIFSVIYTSIAVIIGGQLKKLLPEILQWNYTVSSGELEKLAVQLGEKDFAALHQNLLKFNQDFGINDRFCSAGLTREDFPFIIAHSRSGSMKANPRDLSDNDLYTILESLL